jgi:hypothetical protein
VVPPEHRRRHLPIHPVAPRQGSHVGHPPRPDGRATGYELLGHPHKRTRTKADFSSDAGWRDWQWYDAFRRGVDVTDVKWPKRLSPLRGDSRDYWAQDGIEILSPTADLVRDCDSANVYNEASYVLRVSHGATSSLLLASDVEEKAWNDMIATRQPLRANVLIASHHGRKSGYHAGAMALIRPEVVIVSTAKLPPAHDGVPLYRRQTDVSTRPEIMEPSPSGCMTAARSTSRPPTGTHLVSLSDT